MCRAYHSGRLLRAALSNVWKVHEHDNGDGMLQKRCDEPWKEKMELTIHLCWTLLQLGFFWRRKHMRDEHGCSVSPSHLSSLALWVKCFRVSCLCFGGLFCVVVSVVVSVSCLLSTTPSDPFLHNYCKITSSAN